MFQCANKASTINVITKTKRSLVFVEHFPKNYISISHCHKNKETFHVVKGKGVICYEDTTYHLEKGMTFVVGPHNEHHIFTENEGLELLSVIEGDDTKEIMKTYWDIMKINQ
jgi:mannose-6-phosphate isomerase-like protein (cupin superfamily)